MVRLASPRALRAWSAPGWENFQSPRRRQGGTIAPWGDSREPESSARQTHLPQRACPPHRHTHTHTMPPQKQPTAVLRNHLISLTVYEGCSDEAKLNEKKQAKCQKEKLDYFTYPMGKILSWFLRKNSLNLSLYFLKQCDMLLLV